MSMQLSGILQCVATVPCRSSIWASLVLLCWLAPSASAQQVTIAIQPPIDSPGRAIIDVTSAPVQIWSFPDTYAGVSNLGRRVEKFDAFDGTGAAIQVRSLAPGQYEAPISALRFRYEINLRPPAQASDAARVSWLIGSRGLLMLGDLLPVMQAKRDSRGESKRVVDRIELKLPPSWSIYSTEGEQSHGGVAVTDVDRAVFAVGERLRNSQMTTLGNTLKLVANGDWAFTDDEALKIAGDVLKAHLEVFGGLPAKHVTLILFPFPQAVDANKWSAETRGSTVTLLLGKLPSKTAALSRLSVPLTHELFHLWIPNALALGGDYDWFYEGFTTYQAARTAVRLGMLTFPEFLSAIGRAYDSYSTNVDNGRWSLIEASKRRWSGGESFVYAKSMVVAFLYDLKVRSESRGKRSLDDAYRRIFQARRASENVDNAGKGTDGSSAVVNALALGADAQNFVRSFISEPVTINLDAELSQYGLRVEKFGLRTRITVGEGITKRQRDLLRELGYNDYVR